MEGMEALGFYVFYAINRIVSLLPLRVLYIFSDIFYPVVYYIVRYRRKVVSENLKNSFPEKSENERHIIEKKFYRHFCDLIVEIIKLTYIKNKQLLRRTNFTNPELFEKFYDEGRDIIVIMAHYGNWEWSISIPFCTKQKIAVVYKPLRNKYFDRFMLKMRHKNNCHPVAMSNILREVIYNRKANIRAAYAFITDQTPARKEIHFRTQFLNQDTPVFLGAEKIAQKYDMAVLFLNMQKVKRGFYKMTMELLFEHSKGLPGHLITETHVRRLEEIIREKPEYWLWSHRRWKYKRENTNG